MGVLSRGVSTVGGRRLTVAIGVAYVVVATGLPVSEVAGGQTVNDVLIDSILVGLSGLTLAYGGYRLPRTSIRGDLYHVVASWCLRALGVMLAIVTLSFLAGGVSDPTSGFLVLPSLASVAGLGMGYHDARSKTRALDAEERQREAEQYSRELERYQTIVETVNDGIYITDENNRFTLVNDAYCELVGYDREDLIGTSSSLVLADEADVEALAEEMRRDLADGSTDSKMYETMLETASGEVIDVEWTVSPLPGQEEPIADTVGVVRDVTERNRRQRQLERQNERLESFAGMVAHELRNPVNIGQIYSRQLPDESNPEAVEYVTEAFDRIEDMIDVMLMITRGREAVSDSSPVHLADAAAEAWDEVDAPDATLEIASDQTIEADETYVRHLFRNLFENAVEHGSTSPPSQAQEDAVEHGSTNDRPEDDDAVEHGSVSNQPEADDGVGPADSDLTVTVGDLPTGFYVADDGDGISPEEREAVFGTGYTTAGSRGGMGLGLTFVKEMADVYGWVYSVTESDDGGARFEFENVTKTRSATK